MKGPLNGTIKLDHHVQHYCQFRHENLPNCANTLGNIQAPSKLDLLWHEQMFNTKPQDEYKNLMSFASISNFNQNMVTNIFDSCYMRILEYLIADQKGLTSASQSKPEVICIEGTSLQNNFVNINKVPMATTSVRATPLITSVTSPQNMKIIAEAANLTANIEYGIKCHLCEEKYQG